MHPELHSSLCVDGGPGGVVVDALRRHLLIPLWYHLVMAMTLRLTERDERALEMLAEADGVSKQEATIRAIHEVAARRGHEARVAEASKRVRSRYADVIERLGQ